MKKTLACFMLVAMALVSMANGGQIPGPLYPLGSSGQTWTPQSLGPKTWYQAESNALDSADSAPGTWSGGAAYAQGAVGLEFVFYGTNSISVSTSAVSSNWTVAAWVYASVAAKDFATIGRNTFRVNSDSQLRVLYRNGVAGYILSGLAGLTTARSHIVIVHDGNVDYAYQNGAFVSSVVSEYSLTLPAAGFIGRSPYTAFTGTVDDLMQFDRALSPTDVAELYTRSVARAGEAWKVN